MKTILVDTRKFGNILKNGRNTAKLHRGYAAKMLGTLYKKLQKYESGRELIPDNIMQRLLTYGFTLLATKSRVHK